MFVNARFLTQRVTGVQRYAIEMSRKLKQLRPDLGFLAPHNILHKDLAAEFNVEVIGKRTGYYWEQVELPSYLTKHHPDSVLVNLANVAPIRYRNKIVTIHDVAPLQHPEWYSRRFAYAYRFLLPIVARTSTRIVSDSDFSRREISRLFGVSENLIEVVPCATSREFGQARSSEKKVPTEPYVLSVASLDPRKNFDRLIKAFIRLDLPDVRLVIVGSESQLFSSPGLRDSTGAVTNIIFTGPVDDDHLRALYSHARLFVYPSLYEGFGLPPLEAMACGCPCVVSDTASLPEVCGNAALYCDPYDIGDIADKMTQVLSNTSLRNKLVERGHKRAMQFSWEKSARALLRIIQNARPQTKNPVLSSLSSVE